MNQKKRVVQADRRTGSYRWLLSLCFFDHMYHTWSNVDIVHITSPRSTRAARTATSQSASIVELGSALRMGVTSRCMGVASWSTTCVASIFVRVWCM